MKTKIGERGRTLRMESRKGGKKKNFVKKMEKLPKQGGSVAVETLSRGKGTNQISKIPEE